MQPEVISKIEALASQDYEVKNLWNKHLELNRRIDELNIQHYLSPEQEIELKEMQKQKLLGKDKLFEYLRLAKIG